MNGQYTNSRNWKRIGRVAIVGMALAALSAELDGLEVQAWDFLDVATQMALEVLRPVLLAGWQCVPAHLCENSGCLQHLFQIMASVWPLLCVMAG